MPRPVLLLFVGVLAGCEGQAEVAADMERALADSSTALVGVLLAAETFAQLAEPPDATFRHGDDVCGCPCSERTGTDPLILTLDYAAEGCVAESGLVPSGLAGHVVLDCVGGECSATWDAFTLSLEHTVTGDLSGTFSPGAALSLSPKGALSVGKVDMELDLSLAIDEDGLVIDGQVSLLGGADVRPLTFDGVRLPFDAIGGRCPSPVAGTATLDHERGKKASIVRYGKPGDGTVTVERDKRVSEPADYCAYASELW